MVLIRRTLSILIAGGCIAFIVAVGAGAIRLGINPKEASLALRVQANRTKLFLKTDSRVFFKEVFDELVVPTTHSEPLDLSSLPQGDRYEFAVLTTESGASAWVIYVHQSPEARHQTIVSQNDASLFLPVSKTGLSLERSALIREYAGSHEKAWLFADPKVLPAYPDVIDVSVRALLSSVHGMLIVWRTTGQGVVILQGPHPNLFQRIEEMGAPTEVPLLRISFGSPKEALVSFGTLLGEQHRGLQNGLLGVLRATLKNFTGRTDIDVFGDEMLGGPASLTVMRSGSTVSIGLSGSAKSPQALTVWMQMLGMADAGARVRQIVFPKKENVRIDVVPEANTGFHDLGMERGWHLQELGGSGAVRSLMSAVQGPRYVVATDLSLLRSLIAHSATLRPGEARRTDVALAGTVDMAWLMSMADHSAEAGKEIRAGVKRLLGEGSARVTFDARPVDVGWLMNWSITRSTPPSPSRSLVK
jgi:hypothetical protein